MTFDINAMLQTLPIMGKGMAGIFVVAAVIVPDRKNPLQKR